MRSLLSDSVVYGIPVGMLPVGLLLITPVVSRRLGPVGFGAIDLLMTILTLASVTAIFGIDSGLARSYFDFGTQERAERRIVVRSAFISVFAMSTGLALVLGVGSLFFAEVLDSNHPSSTTIGAIIAACLLLPFSNGVLMARQTFRLERQRGFYVLVTCIQAGVGVGGAVTLVLLGAGPAGYFAGLTLGALAGLAVGFASTTFAAAGTSIDRSHVRAMLRYGLPLVPAALATWVIFAIDRMMLAGISGLFAVGYYSLASKIAAPLFLALTAFGMAWTPFILGQPVHRQPELRARVLTAVSSAVGIGYVVVLLFASRFVDILGGPAFHPSLRAIPGIALGWLAWGIAFVLATEFMVSRRTKIIGIGSVIAAAANVVLNLILIPPFGFVGAAWASAATFGILAAIYFVFERRLSPAPYRWGRLVAIGIVVAIATVFLIGSTTPSPGRLSIAVGSIAALLVIAATDRSRALAIVGDRTPRSP
jgi:O-antigen/teichoic acid export membrane protein